MSNIVQVKVPDIGDFKEVEVIEVLVSEGDAISPEQGLVTVESDKASMEIPSSSGGVVKALKVKVGDKVAEGSVLLEVEAAGDGQAAAAAPAGGTGDADKAPAASQPAASEPRASRSGAEPAADAAAAGQSASAASGTDGPVEIAVPDIGDFKEVEVIEVLVSEGDTVAPEQSLVTVESDKASMEIPSSAGGVVKSLKVKVGDKISKGTVLAVVEGGGAAPGRADAGAGRPAPDGQASAAPAGGAVSPAASASAPDADAAPAAASGTAARSAREAPPSPARRPEPTAGLQEFDTPAGRLPHASPSVRKFARELGVDLGQVQGSGPKGRITADDVRGHVKQALAGAARTASGAGLDLLPWPEVDFSKFGPVEARPLSRIKKISGANLHRNWVMIPHVTNNDEADITDLEALRLALNKENEKAGVKITMLAFLIKAVVAALKRFPEFNASLDGDRLVYKRYFHIGFAADTPNGLMVPVVRDADRKGVLELARETAELAGKAREGKLSPAEMQGGCFSISSLGGIGGTHFTPIINAPEVAILGVSRSAHKPVWDGEHFVPRLILPLSLSYDHRVIDGAAAARFNAYLTGLLADFRRIAL